MTSDGMLHWTDRVALRLIGHAARRAPGDLSERLEEEWRASLAEVRRPLARVRFALGCCWATSVIAREQRLVMAVPAAAAGHASTWRFEYRQERGVSKRSLAFVAVAALHVSVFYALIAGLTPAPMHKPVTGPIENRSVDTPPPPRESLSFGRPAPEAIRIEYQPPRVKDIFIEEPPVTTASTSDPTPPPMPGEVVLSSPPVVAPTYPRHAGGPGTGFPSTGDYYPSASVHSGEQGLATVHACVDVKGRLTSEPTLAKTSGTKRLDDAALRLAKAGSGHYRASTENERPVESCYDFAVRFTLN